MILTYRKKNILTINNFRYLFYCLKFKNQFRKYLWEKIRESKIIKKYSPNYLIENLIENFNEDLDKVLNDWI